MKPSWCFQLPTMRTAKIFLGAIVSVVFTSSHMARADWLDEVGYTRLQEIASSQLPSTSAGVSMVELNELGSVSSYVPDTSLPIFSGKTFTVKSGSSVVSSHANYVGTNFFSTHSLIPGTSHVDLYGVNSWLGSGFLRTGGFSQDPLTETRAVQNHSWVASSSVDEEILRRLDYAIERDGFVSVVGTNNVFSDVLPPLLTHSYHSIAVGRKDNYHAAGLTTIDGTGRMKPDLVSPNAVPAIPFEGTSYSTSMVSSAAHMLVSTLSAAPYSLTGANKPKAVKALLLASATKNTLPSWSNTSTKPLDTRYGAGELNAYHAFSTLLSGRVSASNSIVHQPRAWAAETVNSSASKVYFFRVPAGASSSPFSAALTWHRNVTRNRVLNQWSYTLNDLTLRLYQASGTTLGPEMALSNSSVDNVELIYQAALAPGDYALSVESATTTNTTYGLAWHSLPTVSVSSNRLVLKEMEPSSAQLSITRTGDTNLALYVPLSYGGTAVSGTHYMALPSHVVIPAGASTSNLNITPIADSLSQGTRSLNVAVAADFSFVQGANSSIEFSIEDKPFDSWRFENFDSTELLNSQISGELGDPDADGRVNLWEYATASHPKNASSQFGVSQTVSASRLAISTTKNLNATDLQWDAEVSGNLIDWTPAEIVADTNTEFLARDSLLMSESPARFIRIIIVRP